MTTGETLRIAMWSGPRNISTAMMRSFENRPDTAVVDEPFYAVYLSMTGQQHPMRAEVLASQPTDWRAVEKALLGPAPGGAAIFYQKHMTHHMLADVGTAFMAKCENVFLIRRPEEVVASYSLRRDEVALGDLGVERQAELFDQEADRLGRAPLVLDSNDVASDPGAMLRALCAGLGVDFMSEMLSWPAGRRESDGVWAPAWYDQVERSTGFSRPALKPRPDLSLAQQRVADAAQTFYERLARWKLSAPGGMT
jgi:hypothetical protein